MPKRNIRLRPHHLVLCLQTYSGAGYSEAFVANMTDIAQRLNAGAAVEIVHGPDDICAPMLKDGERFHCYDADVFSQDHLALQALNRVLGTTFKAGDFFHPDPDDWVKLRTAYRNGILREGCRGCSWVERCDESVASNFARSKMRCGL